MSNLFKSPTVQNYTPSGFSTPGVSAKFKGNKYNVTESPELQGLVSGAENAAGTSADSLDTLRQSVTPGYNALLASRLNIYNDSARKALGDLQSNLAARRILGSSFGQDTIQRQLLQQGRDREAITADNFLQSLNANRQLTLDEFNTRQQQFTTGINQLNLEASIASNLTSNASSQLAQNARLNAQLQAGTNAGIGKLIGTGVGLVAAPFTGGASLALTGLGNSISNAFQWGTNSFLNQQPTDI